MTAQIYIGLGHFMPICSEVGLFMVCVRGDACRRLIEHKTGWVMNEYVERDHDLAKLHLSEIP